MINTPGLKLALAGGIVVAASLIALVFLPDTVPSFAMMGGGLAVIGGFVWSLMHFYMGPGASGPPEP